MRRTSSSATTTSFLATPGDILKEEFLDPLGITQRRLAQAIGRPESAVSEIVNGKRAISYEMAMLLGRALGTTSQFWLNLEADYQAHLFDPDRLEQVEVLVKQP